MAGENKYPDTEGDAYSFEEAEIDLDGTNYVGIGSISMSQPTSRNPVYGTRAYPLKMTKGRMDPGELSITWPDIGERNRFIAALGDGFREKKFTTTAVYTAKGYPAQRKVAYGCQLTDEPDSAEGGAEGIGGEMTATFIRHTINGLSPHAGLPSPTRA